MNSWFRFYHEALDDPKVQRLSPKMFKFWINLLCISCRNSGRISQENVAFSLRLTPLKASQMLAELLDRGLIEPIESGIFTPHNWAQRQYKSDGSTERVQRFRERHGNVSETLHETGPDTEQIQIQITEQKGNGERPRKTRAPAELAISDELRAWAIENGITANLEAETAHMLDHFKGKGETRLDWNATWRTWMRNSKKFNGRNGNGNGNHKESNADRIARENRETAALFSEPPLDATGDGVGAQGNSRASRALLPRPK